MRDHSHALLSTVCPLLRTLPSTPVPTPAAPRNHKASRQRGCRCGGADTPKEPRSVCFGLGRLDNSFNLVILQTLRDNTNSRGRGISHRQTCFPKVAPRKIIPFRVLGFRQRLFCGTLGQDPRVLIPSETLSQGVAGLLSPRQTSEEDPGTFPCRF